MKLYLPIVLLLLTISSYAQEPYVIVLGIAQDAGSPHIGCKKECCVKAWSVSFLKKHVVSLALVDPVHKKWWLIEATPDISIQLWNFNQLTNNEYKYLPDGIFITHAHIGHYTGLMQLGREALGANGIPVYTLPKLKTFLEQNGPWEQLVTLGNITLNELDTSQLTVLSNNISIKTFTVPHRDEYSETAGFKILTSNRNYLFIPDINKWSSWDKNLQSELNTIDIAFLDATFYDNTELPGKRMDEVPHPFVIETMQLLDTIPASSKAKVYFIHLNHTNPLLWNYDIRELFIKNSGFKLAEEGTKL